VNKMDTETAGPYKEERYKEIADEMTHMLVKVGWKDTFLKVSARKVGVGIQRTHTRRDGGCSFSGWPAREALQRWGRIRTAWAVPFGWCARLAGTVRAGCKTQAVLGGSEPGGSDWAYEAASSQIRLPCGRRAVAHAPCLGLLQWDGI
jgi:hypothetical protein